eukprot:gene4518-3305_t
MLQFSRVVLDSFKEHYHRVNLPRRLALNRYCRTQKKKQNSTGEDVPYKYNRWWVTNDHEFVHQFAFVEDPDVTRDKRQAMPPVTRESVWREPQHPFFLPFAPYVKVVEYKSDPDAKFMKPINIPRWKDYMQRSKPVVPRTWY